MQNSGLQSKERKLKPVKQACLSPSDYTYLCDFVKTRSGVVLSQDKESLIDSYLLPVARENSLKDVKELISALRAGRAGLANQVINAMMTHETFFFRDGKPFDVFRDHMLPTLKKARQKEKHLKIWSAGCSSGQEPYTISLILKEKALSKWNIDILGTDISPVIIEQAKRGIYTQSEVQRGLPVQYLVKYFKQLDCDWQLVPEIRNLVKYQVRNLMDDFQALGPFDIILCRNVLCLFDYQTKARVLDGIAKILAPDGYLVLGAGETVLGISNQFRKLEGKRGIYQPCAEVLEKSS